MKDLPTIRGRRYIASLVAEGEHSRQDFKLTIDNAHKIAHSVSAFANSEGGRLLIGVKDNGTIAGVRDEEDVYVVEQAARMLCSPSVEVEFTAYSVAINTVVIQASIPRALCKPVRCKEADGRWRAYYRVADENIVSHPLMVRELESQSPIQFRLDATVERLMAFLDANPEGVDNRSIAIAMEMSQRRADNLTVNLIRSGLITFKYKAPNFLLIRNNENPE